MKTVDIRCGWKRTVRYVVGAAREIPIIEEAFA